MAIFTKADIEIEKFYESTKKSVDISKLYKHLDELKSQDIYIVDVSLVSTVLQESSYYGDKIYNEYMIRLVKPKYEVSVETYSLDERSGTFVWAGTRLIGYVKSNNEIEKIEQQYRAKNTNNTKFKVQTQYHSPLEQSI